MPTKWSQTLIPTSRQVPSDAEVPSHQLMIRAGYIRKLSAGVYGYLPLGYRSLRKIESIVRREMDRTGAAEVHLPVLQPIELLEKTGRREAYPLFVVTDRQGREHALGPTHEEVVTELIGAYVKSYKQLPITLYQIQTKFRDEYRPRFGVLRTREFQMKDAYSFDTTAEGLEASYRAMYDAYCRIYDRCGLSYEVVEAESGPIGGSASHEFMVPSPTGEDVILKSDKGNYAANVEKCAIGERKHDLNGDPTGELEKIHTPDCTTIDDVIAFFKKNLGTKLKASNMLKTLVITATTIADADVEKLRTKIRQGGPASEPAMKGEYWFVLAVISGDHDLNLAKLQGHANKESGRKVELFFDEELARAGGFSVGFVGPQQAAQDTRIQVVVDPGAAIDQFWVTGANENDHHVKHFNWRRDVLQHVAQNCVKIADIRNADDGDPSPRNDGGVLRRTQGIEVGHVFKLGSIYTEKLGVDVLGEDNQRKPIIMGCYGIGLNRILAAAIAPYQIVITPIKYEGRVKEVADRIAHELELLENPQSPDRGAATPTVAGGLGRIDVLLDDRAERPGVKFKDADLIGIPLRITVGDKALRDGNVEIKARTVDKPQFVPVESAAAHAAELLATL